MNVNGIYNLKSFYTYFGLGGGGHFSDDVKWLHTVNYIYMY